MAQDLVLVWTPQNVSQSSLDLEYVRIPVSASVAGAPANPTADVVQMAFVLSGIDPGSGDWKAAIWETLSVTTGSYEAACLVGPAGTVTLVPGTYAIWAKVTDNPEVTADQVGTLTVV